MDSRPIIPGGWPLRPETPNESQIIPPPLTMLRYQRPMSETTEVSAISPIDASQDYTLHSAEKAGFLQARPISQASIATETDQPHSRGLLKVSTARTTRTRPFSQTTQESTGIYFDAAEGLETVPTKDDKKVIMETIESKEGSFSGDGSSTTLTPTQTQGQLKGRPQLTVKMMLMQMMVSNKWNDWWIWEILSCLLTVISVAAIIITLVLYNGVALKSWPSPMTPNAFIAMFITTAQLGMVLPVASSISQLKWIWFRTGERALVDFENFDDASRGPIGGLKLALALKTKNFVASFGAFIPILSLALAPCLQQLISYPTKMLPTGPLQGGVALAPRSDRFASYVPQQGAPELPEMSMRQAVQYGLHNFINETLVQITPTCSTADCDWSPYSSLAVCAQVANVTDLLFVRELPMDTSAAIGAAVATSSVALPNGAYLEAGKTVMNITSPVTFVDGQAMFQADHTLAFANKPDVMNTTISDSFVIYQNDINTETPTYGAVELLLSWCINTYNTSVVSAQASTNVLSNSTNVSSTNGGLVLKTEGKEELYTVEPPANFALESYLAGTFSGTYGTGLGSVFSTDTAMAISAALYEQTGTANITGQALDNMQFQAIIGLSQNVATSMSNNVRGRKSQGTPAVGTASEMRPYIHVSWGWLPYIGNMTFSTCLLLAVTIWKTRRTGVDVMKSSALATMTSLSPEGKAFMGPIDYQGKSWMKGFFLKTQLEKTEGVWSLEPRM